MTCPAKNPAIRPTIIQDSNPIIILQLFYLFLMNHTTAGLAPLLRGCAILARQWFLLRGMIGNNRLPDAHGSARAVEKHIHKPFKSPSDQQVYDHGNDGRNFQHHATSCRGSRQTCKGSHEKVGHVVKERCEWIGRIDRDQLKYNPQCNRGFKNAKQQPDQLCGFKGCDTLLSSLFMLCSSYFFIVC